MKSFWWNLMLISQITCHYIGITDRRNISKEKSCLTLNGELGLCVPPTMCKGYVINSSSNDINNGVYPCKRIHGNPMVCCLNIKKSKILVPSQSCPPSGTSPKPASLASATSIGIKIFSKPVPRQSRSPASGTSTKPASFASAASLGEKIFSKPVPSQSCPLSGTRPKPASFASVASVEDKIFFKAVPSRSSLPSVTSPNLASFASAASIRDKIFSKPVPNQSRVTSSTRSPESVLNASGDVLRHKRSSNSTKSFPSTSPPLSSNNSSSLESITPSNETVETSTASLTTMTTTTSKPKVNENDYASEFPKPPVCGVSRGIFSRVVGGNNASIGDFPWVALIAYGDPNAFYFKCGGCMITTQHTLTAAHCIVGLADTIYFVRLGEFDLRNHSQTRPVDALVKTKIAHEKYNTTDLSNDIGILVFYRKIIVTDFIRPICLPLTKELQSNNFERYRPFVAGWGRTSFQGPAATRLQMLQIPVVSQESCRAAYAPLKFINIDQRVLCAGGTVGQDACHGDSGGPLMQPIWDPVNYTTYFYQIGVVALGMKCGSVGWPGVYTRVTEYMPWIQKHVLGTDSTSNHSLIMHL